MPPDLVFASFATMATMALTGCPARDFLRCEARHRPLSRWRLRIYSYLSLAQERLDCGGGPLRRNPARGAWFEVMGRRRAFAFGGDGGARTDRLASMARNAGATELRTIRSAIEYAPTDFVPQPLVAGREFVDLAKEPRTSPPARVCPKRVGTCWVRNRPPPQREVDDWRPGVRRRDAGPQAGGLGFC